MISIKKKRRGKCPFELLIYPIKYASPWPFGTTYGSAFRFCYISSRSQNPITSTPHRLDTPFSWLCLSLTVPIFRLLKLRKRSIHINNVTKSRTRVHLSCSHNRHYFSRCLGTLHLHSLTSNSERNFQKVQLASTANHSSGISPCSL